MGKMNESEILVVAIVGILVSPFIVAGRIIKEIGVSLGWVAPDNYDYDPKNDPNYVETESPKESSGNRTQSSETSKP